LDTSLSHKTDSDTPGAARSRQEIRRQRYYRYNTSLTEDLKDAVLVACLGAKDSSTPKTHTQIGNDCSD